MNIELSEGQFELEFKCDKITSNSDAFVGINTLQDHYSLTSCALPGNGFADKTITYRLNGDFYETSGNCTNIKSVKSKDVVKFTGDFSTKSGLVFVNGVKVADFKLEDIRYSAHVCFGCTEKHKITIQAFRSN